MSTMTPKEIAEQITGRLFRDKEDKSVFIVVSAKATRTNTIVTDIYHFNLNKLVRNNSIGFPYWLRLLEHRSEHEEMLQ